MPSPPPPKKRQHYVWSHYLGAWEDGGYVQCWRDNKVFPSNPINLGVESYFYELRDLEDADDELITGLVERCAPHLRPIADGWHRVFSEPKRLAKAMGSWPELLRRKPEEIRAAAVELEEEIHCRFEEVGIPFLETLRAGKVPSAADMVELLPFLATQYMRTKAIEEAVRRATGDKVARIWQVMRHIYASNLAIGILQSGEFKADLLQVTEAHRFITGDQPVINTQGIWNAEGIEPTTLELFYPVSPSFALLVSKEASWTTRILSLLETNTRNASMARAAHGQVYAQQLADLDHVAGDRRVRS